MTKISAVNYNVVCYHHFIAILIAEEFSGTKLERTKNREGLLVVEVR